MLIKSFGSFWNPDVIDWPAKKMQGEIRKGNGNKGRPRKYDINFYEAKGIYVLHSDFGSVYVGKAFRTSIGKRVSDHLSDRLAGRWDMFSWFSVSSPRTTQQDVSQPGQRQLNPETVINTLEALAILIADPRLNRKRESLSDAFEAIQPSGLKPNTIRSYLEKILENTTGSRAGR